MPMIDAVGSVLLLASAVYWLVALVLVSRYRRVRPSVSDLESPVTILKPLRGDDGQLYENLRSFCRQDYPNFEIVFGVRHLDDPAVRVVERLKREFPAVELKLIGQSRIIGANLKVSNLANLLLHAKHDTLIVADSDMRVDPGYIRAVVAPLADPSVGLVTCLYRGVAPCGVASRLGAMFINEWFLPAALVGIRLERLRHGFGATVACRRDTLRAVGGFEVLADRLADDYMLGRLVSDLGLRVVLAPYLVENVVTEQSLLRLLAHEVRWARTFRTLRPVRYFCSLLTYGIPLSLLWVAATGGSSLAVTATALHLGLRVLGRPRLYHALGQPAPWRDTWLVPIRDLVSFFVGITSYLGHTVRWHDELFRVHRDGRLEPRSAFGTRARCAEPGEVPSLASDWEKSA